MKLKKQKKNQSIDMSAVRVDMSFCTQTLANVHQHADATVQIHRSFLLGQYQCGRCASLDTHARLNGVVNSCRLIHEAHSFHVNMHIHIMFEVSSSLPSAIPAGVFLQVDGKARGADRLCGRQRNLPQADVSAAGLLPPLQ